MPSVAEACPNGLAPTTSTLMTLALGDALAMVLMDRREFTAQDFGLHHPGGSLGMSLQSVREWMGDNAAAPANVPLDASFSEVVSAITLGRKGAVAVLNPDGTLAGIVTDGDLRRAFQRDVTSLKAADIMGANPITVDPDARMSDVVDLLTANKISNLFVVEDGRPTAIVHIAAALNKKIVALYREDPQNFANWQPKSQQVHLLFFKQHIEEITPQQMVAALDFTNHPPIEHT